MAGGLSESLGEEQPSAPRRTNWSAALTILAFLGLALVPVLVRHTPREVSQWYLAAAIRAQADGPRAAALRYLDESLRWNPDNVDAWLTQAQWRGQEREYEAALASCNRAPELREDDVRVYYERSQILQHLRRGAEAIADARHRSPRPRSWPR